MLISMCDPDNPNLLRVKYSGSWTSYYTHATPDIDLGYADNYPVVSGQFGTNVGNWWEYGIPIDNLGLLYTELGWAKEYTHNEWDGDKTLTKHLAVKIESDRKLDDNSEVAHYNPANSTIHLGTDRYDVEGTVFHEFGHFVFHNIYGLWNYGVGLRTSHYESWNNATPSFTMDEGIASAFSGIMDEMTYAILGESSNERRYHNLPFFRIRTRVIDGNTVEVEHLNAPVLSEEYLATVVLDLWDGVLNYATYNNPTNPNRFDIGQDDFEMSFKEISAIFWNNLGNVESIYDFYKLLIKNTDCAQKPYIRRIFQFNSENIDGSVNDVNFPQFSTDEISVASTFDEIGFKVIKQSTFEDINFPLKTKEITNSFSLDVNVDLLDGSNDNFNLDHHTIGFNGNVVTTSPMNQFISDDLDISNGATLEVNTNNVSEFYNSGGIPLNSGQTIGQPNSTLHVDVCEITTLNVNNSSFFEVGNSELNSQRNANVNFNNNSTLNLNSGSTFTINDNSKVTFQAGSILRIFPNSVIILNGPNAVLEIKGQIQLMNGATFTVSGGTDGLGYVKFFRNNNSNLAPLISSPTNDGKVELIGTSSTNKLIEIDGTEGLKINSDIVDFTIKQAKVLLGGRSSIEPNVSGKVFFESVKIDRLFNDYEHNGIRINGVKNEFHLVTVTGGNYGFINTGLIIGNEKLNLRAVHIVECSIGIMTYSSGINYLGGLIKGYSIAGWKSVGANVPSDITGVWFNNDQSNSGVFGVLLDGVNSAGSSTFTGSKFQSNASGIQAWNVPVRLKSCNYFEANDIGIQMEAWSNLDLSNNSYTTFNGNDIHILSRFHGIMHMNDGHNGFLSSGNSSIFWASLQPGAQSPSVTYLTLAPTPENYYANNNFFQTTPSWGNNFYLDERGSRVLNLTTNNFYPNNNPSVWTSAQNNVCGTPDYETLEFTFNGGGLGQFNVSKYSTLSGVTIPSGLEYGNNLLNVCSGLLDSLYMGYAPNYSSITCGLGHLARKTFSNNSPIMANLKLELLDHAIKAYAIGVSKNAIFVREDSLSFASNCLLGTIDTLLIDANNDSLPWKNVKFNLSAAKAEVLRIAEHRDDASMYLNSALNIYTDSLEQIYLNKWSCIIEAEQAFIDSLVTLDSIYINYPCYGQEIEFSAPMPNTTEIDIPTKKKEELKNSMFVYPNPASDLLKVVLNNKQEIVKIVICDLKGMVLYSSEISAQNSETEIDLSAFSSGSYVISVMSDQAVFHSPLIISK